MDNRLLLGIAGLAVVAGLFAASIGKSQETQKPKIENIVLTDANSVLFRDEVNSQSIAKLQDNILKRAAKLNGKPLYLILDTPGGDPSAYDLVDMIKGLNVDVKTITQFSASMGAYISQALGERLVTEHGTYMFHRARVDAVGGQIPGELNVRVGMIQALVDNMEQSNAKRMGLSMEQYTKLVKDEYYVSGQEAVKEGVADRVISISCGPDLQGTYVQNVKFLFFTLDVTYSQCPAIRGPLDVKAASGAETEDAARNAVSEFLSFIHKQHNAAL